MRYRFIRWAIDDTGTFQQGAHHKDGPWFRLNVTDWYNGVLQRGLPAYTPTEPQPTRCGGTEA